ncbi:MAG: leucine-rich repeat domain-containing protein [Myxococcales bacterium]|nr:leucine-rich repeat domain-containing protein [Myxococcales bacterium]
MEAAESKLDRKSFKDEATAQAFVAKQVRARVERGYHVELPFEQRRWADVQAEVVRWISGNSERSTDRVLVYDGDLTIPHSLWLDYRRGMLALADERDPPFSGIIVRGSLRVEGCLYNYEDDYGPFLLVTGNLEARSIATGGARICVLGDLSADVIVGVYNHGSMEAKGTLCARVVASEHAVTAGKLNAIYYRGWGRNALPFRDGIADDSEPYEPRGIFVSAVLKGEQVDLNKARDLAIAGKAVVKDDPASVRVSFRKLVGKKLADADKLKSLSLPGKDLTFLPEEIFSFRKLERLTLTHNKLRRLPDELGQLTELRELHVRGNGLQELPDSIGQLSKLRVLDLEANCIWRLPESLAQCTELRTINLTNNPYSYVRSSFGGWTKVKLMWEFPEVLTRLPKLEELVFSGTFLRELPRRRFDSPFLRRVSIENSLVQKVDPGLHDQITVRLEDSPRRAANYIRYWFDNDEIHLEDFYDAKTDTYDFTQVQALLELLLQINIPISAPYNEALAEFAKQVPDVIRGLSWGSKNTRHIQSMFRAFLVTLEAAERTYPGNALIAGLRVMFARHAG